MSGKENQRRRKVKNFWEKFNRNFSENRLYQVVLKRKYENALSAHITEPH